MMRVFVSGFCWKLKPMITKKKLHPAFAICLLLNLILLNYLCLLLSPSLPLSTRTSITHTPKRTTNAVIQPFSRSVSVSHCIQLKSISNNCRVQHPGLRLSCSHHSYYKHTRKHYTHQRTCTLPTYPSTHTHTQTSYPPPSPPWSPGSLCHSLTLSRLRYELNDSSDASPRTEGATARPRPPTRLEGRPEAPLCTLIITSMVVASCHTVVLACTCPSVCGVYLVSTCHPLDV